MWGNDRLVAVVGLIDRSDSDEARDQRALIESCPNGWWYSAELSKSVVSQPI